MNRLRTVLWAAALSLLSSAAMAQAYPSQQIRMVVPFPPGGPTDVLGRVVAQGLGDDWKQTVVVENKAGAAGNIGVQMIAKAPADGYTMGVVPAGNIAVNPALFPNLPYKASELAPVSLLATVENVLVVPTSLPAKTLKELLAMATARPGVLTFASPGAGSQAHLAGELLQLASGTKMIHVPYKGTGPALNDLLGGQVTMMFAQLSSALPHIQSGKLRAIGVASLQRSPTVPEVPTIAEQGVDKFEAVSWYALMVPAATPPEVVTKIAERTAALLGQADTRSKLSALGMTVGGGTPQALASMIASESVRWAEVIRKQNIKVE